MKRVAPYRPDSPPASSVNAAMNLALPDTIAVGNRDDSSIAEQNHHHAAALEAGQTDAMPFPGPFAYAVLPVVADQPGRADVAAAHTTSTTTEGSPTAAALSSRADAPANSAVPEAPPGQLSGQASLAEDREANTDGLQPLIRAAKLGDLDQLRMLLAQPGTDVNQVEARSGGTALIFAAVAGRPDMVELLLAGGADGNFRTPRGGMTALMMASLEGNLEVVNALLGHSGILLEQAVNDGRTALLIASTMGHAAIVERLIDAGANVNYRDPGNGLTALVAASARGNLEVLNVLLERPGILLDQVGNDGMTALDYALTGGHTAVVERLIDAGADRNYRHPNTGLTALMQACWDGKLEMVNALLGLPGILLNQADHKGWTALDLASNDGHAAVVERLIDAGADRNYRQPSTGLTALMRASAQGELEVVNALLGRPGILLDQVGNDGMTALDYASENGHADIVERLIDAGADVHYRDPYEPTALMKASAGGNLELVNALLRHSGILLDQANINGKTALAFASKNGHAAIVERLIDAGADFNHRDDETGKTALIIAAKKGNEEVVDALLRRPGILLDQADINGWTALAGASMNGHAAIVERLVNAGANSALRDMNGRDCMHHALNDKHVNVVEFLLGSGIPLPAPFGLVPSFDRHFVCLSDLYFDQSMPAASANNPLRLSVPDLLDNPDRFLPQFINEAYAEDRPGIAGTLAHWLQSQGIRQAVVAPLMRCLGEGVDDLLEVLMAPDAETVNDRQQLVYCASTLGRLAVLAPDEQIAAIYRNAGLSEAGVTRLSQLAIAQRDKLVSLGQAATAQIATDMLGQLVPECIAKTSSTLRVDVDALGTSLIDAGFIPPLANLLARSWDAALVELAATPAATAQMGVISDMVAFIQKRIEEETPGLFARQIGQRLDQPDLISAWRATLGETSTEGLFALFDDQCRQLREYGQQQG